tara:strand:+ start:1350 stop:1706 length:357 start_codon:yes stop_codon:yes gene_type:complete
MATLNAKLTLSGNDLTSDALNMTVSDAVTVSKSVEMKRIALSTTAKNILPAASYTKAFVYVKNVDTNISIKLVKSEGGDVYMDVGPGEFGFFPWDTAVDLFADAASGTPTIEVGIFEV